MTDYESLAAETAADARRANDGTRYGWREASWIINKAVARHNAGDEMPTDIQEFLLSALDEYMEIPTEAFQAGYYDAEIAAIFAWVENRELAEAETAARIAYGVTVPDDAFNDDVGLTEVSPGLWQSPSGTQVSRHGDTFSVAHHDGGFENADGFTIASPDEYVAHGITV